MLNRFSRILVVDDSVTMRKIVRHMLTAMGFEKIDEAFDGQSALQMLSVQRYSLVISDWNMQPMNGLELLKRLQAANPMNAVPFIMMTAHAVKFAEVAREAGAMHLLTKPFDKETLAAKIRSLAAGFKAA